MKIYHVETQEDYNSLMTELETKGCKWESGDNPTAFDNWYNYKEKTYVKEENKELTYGNVEISYVNSYSEYPLIKYKTKEEMKRKLQENALDVSVAIESFARGIKFQMKKSTVEDDLKEAKSSAKKLIEKIDEYLEYQKPKFKVGDCVTVYVNGKEKIAKIDKLTENNTKAHGLWYDRTLVNVMQDYWFTSGLNEFRHARQSEIAEYEAALQFHKHGRKPFEIKEGDILRDDEGSILINDESILRDGFPKNLKKNYFTSGHYTFLKTVEEYNEWLESK